MPVHQRYSQFQSDQRQFFNELITEDWSTYKSAEWDYTREFEVSQLFKRVKPVRILDIGCGVGFHDVAMAKYSFVKNVDAFDYSKESILRANSEYPHPKVNRFVADFHSFEVKQLYDLVVSFQVFEHLTDPEKYMSFSANVCRSGGIVAICTPNRFRLDNRIRAFYHQPPILIDVMHFREYTANEIFELGNQFGLKSAGWFGHSLHLGGFWGGSWFAKLSYQKRTELGYYFSHFSHVICVLMKKV